MRWHNQLASKISIGLGILTGVHRNSSQQACKGDSLFLSRQNVTDCFVL